QDQAATAVQVAGDRTEEVLGRRHGDLHDRLEQLRAGLAAAFAEGEDTRLFEGDLRRVDFVVRTVEQRHLDVTRGEAGQDAALGGLADAVFHRRDVFAGDAALGDLVFKRHAVFPLEPVGFGLLLGAGFDGDRTVAELTATARLLLVRAASLGLAA